ncbi:hypothetical protein WJX75_003943 [Coccomyxa subellipsoidea]|uniref:RNI-like protein n=1 Tax=Coccomyxa subellipsoidea TaxID=248742 RepID=A0ABR2YVD2_9CHLO
MGQYWILCNLDKKERLEPRDLDCVPRLYEMMAARPGVPVAFFLLVAAIPEVKHPINGRWAGDKGECPRGLLNRGNGCHISRGLQSWNPCILLVAEKLQKNISGARPRKLCTSVSIKCLADLPRLAALDLSHSVNVTDGVLHTLANTSGLTWLGLNGCSKIKNGTLALANLQKLKRLEFRI